MSILSYAFAGRGRAPDVPPGASAFTIHEQSSVAMLFGALAGVSVMETVLLHLVVARWSVAVAWGITAINVYAAIWFVALARSFALLPVLVTETAVVVRSGMMWRVEVPRGQIASIAPASGVADLRIPVAAEPNVVLWLKEPIVATGLYGITRKVSTIGIAFDDPNGFERALSSQQS